MSAPRYYSTRDKDKTLVSFEAALLKGLASDGGLYLPEFVPKLDAGSWLEASSLAEIGVNVLGAWLGDELPAETLSALVGNALDFPAPVAQLSETLWVLELFHGPTRSFKDFGARTMARLMQHFLEKRGEERIILVATSGDTGSAVADGFAGMENIEVVLLYPKGKVSPVQERQLIVKRPGVTALALEGDFDDCQRLVKEAFRDPALSHLPLSSANSINIGRLLPQTVYYLWAVAQTKLSDFNLCVPSGNLGNLTAAVLASLMGQPVNRFLAAHNDNRFFSEFLASDTDASAFPKTLATVSNAMDVGSPSNFERLLHLLGAEDLRRRVWGTSVDDASTLDRMNAVYSDYGYIACPHTAVGLEAVARYRAETGDERPAIAVATAHPAKFPEAVREALVIEAPVDEGLERLWERETSVQTIPPRLEALRDSLEHRAA